MNDILQKLIELKLPSLIIFGGFVYLSIKLLENSPDINTTSGISGVVCVGITVLLGVYSFIEHLIKEHYESIIKTQQEALKVISTTHSKFEDQQQRGLTDTSDSIVKDQYTDISNKSETHT